MIRSDTGAAPPQHFPSSLGALKQAGYRYRSVKQELRENALDRLRSGQSFFPGIVGFDDSVIPQIIQSLLSGHDLLLLGLRGQAKTRILRAFSGLLDEWIPIIGADGVDLPDDPVHPTTSAGRATIAELGDQTPVRWLHRSERFHEKLATPDVTIADLIGEIDLVKHAEGRYLSDERTMHFGLVPRSNRGIFVMNELPDLSPRIQVGLFNVLEERDIQIRGYPIRLTLDLCLLFSANPEDYTNRGRIVTPLKDRIGSVVRTHYPADNREAMRITRENAFVDRRSGMDVHPIPTMDRGPRPDQRYEPSKPTEPPMVDVPPIMHEILEEMIRQARTSPHINQSSGVSVRAAISALECLVSSAEIRGVRTGEKRVVPRVCDASHIASALRGKIELMLAETSTDGVATEDRLIEAFFGEALNAVLSRYLRIDAMESIVASFASGTRLELTDRTSASDAVANLKHVDGLVDAARSLARKLEMEIDDEQHLACAGELILEFLYVNNRLSKMGRREGGGVAYAR